MKVLLSNRGNPDMRQDPDRPVYGCPEDDVWADVENYKEASSLCRAYIKRHQLGGGNWSGGAILGRDLKQIAYVSYNGRVWTGKPQDYPNNTEIKI